jgi:poly(ADP-ribose) glycohydrolase ARH3
MQEGQDYKHWSNELFPGGSFGNGAAMRVAPVGLHFHRDTDRLWEQARLSSLPTHVHPLGIEGAQLVALSVAICLRGLPFERVSFLAELQKRSETSDFRERLSIAERVQSRDDLLQLGNGIAAQDSAITSIACFTLWPESYEHVVSNAILIGGDTDTIAAMAGAISGAYLGVDAIPKHFLNRLEDDHKGRTYIMKLAQRLAAL